MSTLDLARQQGYREGYSRALADVSEQIAAALDSTHDAQRDPEAPRQTQRIEALHHVRAIVRGLRERARRRAEVSTHELRYQRDEHGREVLDEVVARGADLHLERMDADEWLLIARLADGAELRVTLWADREIEARAEVERG